MVKKGYGALIIGANSSCSNLNFFKKEIIRINYVLLPLQA